MARGWWWVVAGLAALGGAGVGGCGSRRALDPGEMPGPDGGAVGIGAPPATDGGAPPPDGSAVAPTPDAGGGITTAPPISMCALSPGRLPVAPLNPTGVGGCARSLAGTLAMSVGRAPPGQSYVRCATVGQETSWRVTLSADGHYLAARTSAGTVRLYRTDIWQEIVQLASPLGMIDAVAFSPDATLLATLSGAMGQLTIWNAADGSRAATFDAPPISTIGNPSSALAFSSDGRRVATSLNTIVDLQTGTVTTFGRQPLGPYSAPVNPSGSTSLPDTSVYSMRFVGCDQRLLINGATPGGMSGWVPMLSLVDPTTSTWTGIAGSIFSDIGSVVASPDGRWVAFVQRGDAGQGLHLYDAAAASDVAFDSKAPRLAAGFSRAGDRLFVLTDTTIEVRQVPTLRLLGQVALPAGNVTAAAVSPSDQVIVSTDSTSAWIDPSTGAVRRGEMFPISGPEFSGDGHFGVTAGTGATLFHLWSESNPSISCAPAAIAPDAAIATFAVSQDARTLATVDLAGRVQLRPVVDGTGEVGAPRTAVETGLLGSSRVKVAVADGGGRVAVQGSLTASTSYKASRLVVADTATGASLLTRDIPRGLGSLALSSDGAWVAFEDGDYTGPGHLVALSVATGATALPLIAGQIDSFSPNSKSLAVAGDGGMQVWDLVSGVKSITYSLPGSSVGRVAMSPDWFMMGGWVEPSASASDWSQQSVQVWRPQDGMVMQQIGQQLDYDGTPRFDSANSAVAMFVTGMHTLGTNWNAWRVWSTSTGTLLRLFPMSSSSDEPLAFTPGGLRLLTRAGTGIAVWCR